MAHYYNKDGKPMFDIIGKNGNKRKLTIKDVREHDLYPSVTTVLGILAAPELETWKQDQIIRACGVVGCTNKEAILDEAFKKASIARDYGDLLHKYINQLVTGNNNLEYPDILPATKKAIAKEFERIKLILGSEQTVVDHDLGVAGTYDLFCVLQDDRRCLVDFKNQTTLTDSGTSKKITVYNKSKMQAAEYAKIVNADCVVIFTISRDEAGRCEWYELTPEEYADSKEMFRYVSGMYRLDKKLRTIKE